MPGSSLGRKTKGAKRGKRGHSDYEDELEGFTRTTGRQREFIRYWDISYWVLGYYVLGSRILVTGF